MAIKTSDLLLFAQSLIRIQSLSGEEEAVADCIARQMRTLEFDKVTIDVNGSVVGVIYGDRRGPTLLLDGHCDTVGVASSAGWQRDPYAATVHNGYLYGRGASDMKGALAAMIYAAAAANRSRLGGQIAVSATVMEEVMEGVALGTVMEQTKPDYVVIGEATDLNLVHGGRGRAEILFETTGNPAHSSSPHLGVNAVHRMWPAVQAVERMPLSSDPLLGDAIMVLTDIISDPYPGRSVIPSRCRVTYDRRLLPAETEKSVLQSLRELPELQEVSVTIVEGKHETYTGAVLCQPKFFPAWKLPADHEFVQRSLKGLKRAGIRPVLSAYSFCTNAAHSAGRSGVPTVGFGPSKEGQAHVVDEYIELEEIFAAARGYLGIIETVLS